MKWNVSIIVMALVLGCEHATVPPTDQTTIVKGIVLDQQTLTPLDSVIIGWKQPGFPDSLLFPNGQFHPDSIVVGLNLADAVMTNQKGEFALEAFLSPMPPHPYGDMFAFKKTYTLWRFSASETVLSINSFTDSIAIKLSKAL